jgi:TonB family protein
MTTYLVKTILCSAILILIYYLFFEREKIFRFNRLFLLFSIAFAFIVPLIPVKIRSTISLIPETVYQPISSIQIQASQQTIPSVNENFTIANLILLLYIIVTLFLFCRFIVNIFVLLRKIKNNRTVPYDGAILVLTSDKHVPHSFLKYIFINKEDFEKGKIEKEILCHELAHIKQGHTADILFIEFITIYAWINPMLYLYKIAIQLNHEFLADEYVINTFNSPLDYQFLLLDKSKHPSVLVLSSSFNYFQTKKRLIMMTKKASNKIAILKQIALIPVILFTGFLFSAKVIAQETKKPIQQQANALQQQQRRTPEDDPSFKHDKYTFSVGFSSWVASQVKYPPKALKRKIQGWVHVGYTVDLEGTVTDVRINSAPDPGLGEAVAKVVKTSPKWMPAKNTANASLYKSVVNIKFEIPEKVMASEDIPVFVVVEQMPQFPLAKDASPQANRAAVGEWVAQHLKYPKKAIKEKVEGSVVVRFIVTKNGKLEDLIVMKPIHPLLDAEALRVVSLMPDWKAAKQGGDPRDVYYATTVEFKLPK